MGVIYKEMFYLPVSNRIVVHIISVKCGNLIHCLSGKFAHLAI